MIEEFETDVSLWVTTEGGTVHLACDKKAACVELGDRLRAARVLVPEGARCDRPIRDYICGPCCWSSDVACTFDMETDEDLRRQLLVQHSLAMAELREADAAEAAIALVDLAAGRLEPGRRVVLRT